jgi:type IV pilus biogenesis protein CpaD/CtpE
MEIGTERFLRLYLAMDENFVKNSFGDRSNLAAASTLLADKIKEKLHEAALKMKANPIDVDLAPLESKAPIKVSRVVFSDQGSLAIDVELVSFRGVIKKKSKATSEGASP